MLMLIDESLESILSASQGYQENWQLHCLGHNHLNSDPQIYLLHFLSHSFHSSLPTMFSLKFWDTYTVIVSPRVIPEDTSSERGSGT